jgi:prepilin-type N-terminal cleavage/methylation domain-containing protein
MNKRNKEKRMPGRSAAPSWRAGFTLVEMLVYIALFAMIAVTLVSLAYASAAEDGQIANDVINAYENQ